MKYDICIAGFGGQGVMLLGQMLGRAACDAGLNATFCPSYGPEQRGGTANCSVVISDTDIGSPIVAYPGILVCFNRAALAKFLPVLQPNGILVLNTSQAALSDVTRSDITLVDVPADKLALELGSPKVANVIVLGALVKKSGVLTMEQVESVVLAKLAKKPPLLQMNKDALQRGAQLADAV